MKISGELYFWWQSGRSHLFSLSQGNSNFIMELDCFPTEKSELQMILSI